MTGLYAYVTYGLGYLFTATANNGIVEGRRISEQIIMHFVAYVLSNTDNSVLGDVRHHYVCRLNGMRCLSITTDSLYSCLYR